MRDAGSKTTFHPKHPQIARSLASTIVGAQDRGAGMKFSRRPNRARGRPASWAGARERSLKYLQSSTAELTASRRVSHLVVATDDDLMPLCDSFRNAQSMS